MAKRQRKEPSASGESGGRLLTAAELERLMSALGAAGAVLLEAANLIEEAMASGRPSTFQQLRLRPWAWRLGFRADALSDDLLALLPEVAERLQADDTPSPEMPLISARR